MLREKTPSVKIQHLHKIRDFDDTMLFRKSFLLFHFRIFCISQQAQQTFAEKKNFMFFLHRHRRQGDKTFPLSMTAPRAENEWRRRGGRGCSLSPASGKQQKSRLPEKTGKKFHISASRLLLLLNTEFHPSLCPEDVPGSLSAAGWMPITCARTFKRRTEE